MALEICYTSTVRRTEYSSYDEDGNGIEHERGVVVEVFIPDARRDDIDRNTDMRAEVSEKIDAAITAFESG